MSPERVPKGKERPGTSGEAPPMFYPGKQNQRVMTEQDFIDMAAREDWFDPIPEERRNVFF